MSNNEVVLQLAKFNDKSSTNNAEWSNHINESVIINEGDQIIVSKAFIDTRDLASENIVISEDTELELEMYFYWINDSNPGSDEGGFGNCLQYYSGAGSGGDYSTGNVWFQYPDTRSYPNVPTGDASIGSAFETGAGNTWSYTPPDYSVQLTLQSEKNISFDPDIISLNATANSPNIVNASQNVLFADGRPYVMCYTDNKPYTQTWKYTLKKGSYSPDQLASILTSAMAEVSKDKAADIQNNQTNNWFSSGQPFIANTAAYPPVWAVAADTRDDDHHTPAQWQQASLVDGQPYIQIDAVRGLPTADDWQRSTLGSTPDYDPVFNNDPNGPGPNIQTASGIPPKPSLTFKNFISDAPTPNPSLNLPVLPSSTTISADNMVVNNYYKIETLGDTLWKASGDTASTISIGDEFVCTGVGTLPPNPSVPALTSSAGVVYKISDLGLAWNGGYNTNWAGLGATDTPLGLGQVFTAVGNPALGYQQATTPAELDLVNNFGFDSVAGYDLSTIGGPSLPPTTPANIDINTTKQGNWISIVNPSPIFKGSSPSNNGVDYTQFMGASQTTIPPVGTQYVSLIDMVGEQIQYNPPLMTGLDQLNAVDYNMKIEVTQTSALDWSVLGYVNPNPTIFVDDARFAVNDYYKVLNVGNTWGLLSTPDTNWAVITGSANPVAVNNVIECVALSPNTPLTNATIYNVNDFAGNYVPYAQQRIIIVDMGTSVPQDWLGYIAELNPNLAVGDYAQLLPTLSVDTLNGTGATFQILQNGYLNLGVKILVTNADKIDWPAYNNSLPVATGDSFTISTIPPFTQSITNSGTGFTPMADTFAILPTAEVVALDIVVPFIFVVTELPTTPFTDTTWQARIIPTDIVYSINNYTTPVAPFIPTGALTTNVISPTMTAHPVPTGLISFPDFTQGTCIELFNPVFPNFYIYPLVKQQYLCELSWTPLGDDGEVDAWWGGPCVSYGFPTMGSTEIELAFDDSKNRFVWNYTHSPIQQGEAPSTAGSTGETTFANVVGIINSFTPNVQSGDTITSPFKSSICKLTSQSGLMFKKMNPPDFWHKLLGFSTDLLVTDDDLGFTTDGTLKPLGADTQERFTYERFNSVTTRDILSTAMNFSDSANFPNSQPSYIPNLRANTATSGGVAGPVQLLYEPVINSWSSSDIGSNFMSIMNSRTMRYYTNPPDIQASPLLSAEWFQALDETLGIDAVSGPQIITNEYGHYLISITGYGDDKNGMLNETMKIDSKAIVSNYYVNQGSFVSLTFPDSQTYTHIGESVSLNNFSVRIIDPETTKTIDGLGENTCIYIQLNKQYSQQELEQPTEV